MGYKLDMLKMIFKRANPTFKKLVKKEKIDNQVIKYAQIDNCKPNCTLKMVDSGHVVMYEKPEVVIEAIREMLEDRQ